MKIMGCWTLLNSSYLHKAAADHVNLNLHQQRRQHNWCEPSEHLAQIGPIIIDNNQWSYTHLCIWTKTPAVGQITFKVKPLHHSSSGVYFMLHILFSVPSSLGSERSLWPPPVSSSPHSTLSPGFLVTSPPWRSWPDAFWWSRRRSEGSDLLKTDPGTLRGRQSVLYM